MKSSQIIKRKPLSIRARKKRVLNILYLLASVTIITLGSFIWMFVDPSSFNGRVLSAVNVNSELTGTAGVGIPASTAWEPSGNFRFTCSFSHLAWDDPIVYPNQSGASHLHMFFGNTETKASSTYQTLLNNGDGTCQGGPINRSAYWSPAIYNSVNKVVIPSIINVYYKSNGMSSSWIQNTKELPTGLRMIAGYDMANPGSGSDHSWFCESNPAAKTNTIPHCNNGDTLLVRMQFPNCWNGSLDSANHRNHIIYMPRDGHTGQLYCPSSHPTLLPAFELTIRYPSDGNTQNWYLSSDRMSGMIHANGSTFHTDRFGAWELGIQSIWTQECIVEMRNCDSGQIGDGRVLLAITNYSGPRTVSPPPVANNPSNPSVPANPVGQNNENQSQASGDIGSSDNSAGQQENGASGENEHSGHDGYSVATDQPVKSSETSEKTPLLDNALSVIKGSDNKINPHRLTMLVLLIVSFAASLFVGWRYWHITHKSRR